MLNYSSSIFDKTIPLDESKKILFNEHTPFSLAKTSSSFKEMKIKEVPKISNFSEIFNPLNLRNYKSSSNSSNNLNSFFPFFNKVKIDSFKSLDENFNLNFLGKKKDRNIKDCEIFFKNRKKENIILIDEKENSNNLNLSAFKEIKISNKEENNHKSAFKKKISFNKIILNNKINKKKLINKIIINETNNIPKKSENNNKSNKKFKIINPIRPKKDEGQNNDEELLNSKKKRGRKPKSGINIKRVHNASDYDNILRKIQVHFLTFLIYFTNDLLDTFLPKHTSLRFKNLDYDLKKPVNHTYVQRLKSQTVGEILQLKASSKNRKFDSSINQQNFNKICEISPILRNFFKLSFINVFNDYYSKTTRNFTFEGIKINISQRTKLLIDLLAKNPEAEDKIQQIASTNFANIQKNDNDNKQPIFIINKKK